MIIIISTTLIIIIILLLLFNEYAMLLSKALIAWHVWSKMRGSDITATGRDQRR